MKTITITDEELQALDFLWLQYIEWDTIYKNTSLLNSLAFAFWVVMWSWFWTFAALYFLWLF